MLDGVLVVTGGASGIGLACAKAMVAAHEQVALIDVNEDGLAAAAAQIHEAGGVASTFFGDVADADAFRAALKAAEFDSVRGDFAFGDNHHPVQDIYVREVIKEGDVYTNKIIATGLSGHADAYAADCKM